MRKKLVISFFLLILWSFLATAQPPDSITVAASEKYKSLSLFQKGFVGINYRKEWQTPVKMPVFDLTKSKMKIKVLGGGQQTTSLYLVDENKKEWILRSVDKEVKPPKKFMEKTFIEDVIQDHVSAAYPYAGLSVAVISKAAAITASETILFYVPDDIAFGKYRSVMANRVFLLISNLPESIEEFTTEEMIQKLSSGKNYSIDQKEYLKVRLVDWLISDWDRHTGQYKWIEKNTSSGIVFHVIPRDRDQAFFKSDGIIVNIASMFSMPHMEGFKKSSSDIKKLSYKTNKLDKLCTSLLTKEDWISITKEFQSHITDNVIEAAIKKQPPEIFSIRGNEIINILKSRRDQILENAMEYYSILNP